VGRQQNTIELNGNRYDASTGRLAKDNEKTVLPAKPITHSTKTGQALDGFIKPSHKTRASQSSSRKSAVSSRAIHATTVRSKTLMRQTVKKPRANDVAIIASQNHHPVTVSTPEPHNIHIDPVRASRAAHVQKSTNISRFGSMVTGLTKRTASIQVRPAPSTQTALHALSAPISSIASSTPKEPLASISLALQNATAHQLPRLKKPSIRQRAARKLRVSPKAVSVASGVFVIIFFGGLLAYLSMPQMALQLASKRAGVKASLPAYQPSGFEMKGPVQYSSGSVTLNYASASNGQKFQVVQKSSDWNSQSLLENFVVSKEPYQTFQDKGRTIYIYEGGNATWVSGGIWYQVEGNSSLSSDQLRRVVSSL